MYAKNKDLYTNDFKEKIIQAIIDSLNLGLAYKPDKSISSKEYKSSGLFRHKYNYYDGEDFLKGNYSNVSFHCSELHTQYDGLWNNQITIFKGLFFAAAVNPVYKGTYIWNSDDEQIPKSLSDEEYRLLHLPKVKYIRSGNPYFEKHFSVYSSNPSEAAMILNGGMIENILHFRKQIKRNFRLSFVAGRCYVAIPFEEDLLEPSVSDPGNKENIKEYFYNILLILSIINQLNLKRLT